MSVSNYPNRAAWHARAPGIPIADGRQVDQYGK